MTTSVPRRSFLGRATAIAAALGITPALSAFGSPSETASPGNDLDHWLTSMHGPQKVLYDCTTPAGASDGIVFARNFVKFSQEKLGMKDSDMSVIVSFRHFGTPFGYSDAMWAKYPQFADMLKFTDPKTGKLAARNVALDEHEGFPNASPAALLRHGVQFAVCGAATAFFSGVIAGQTGDARAIEDELGNHLIPGGRIVPAGVIVVQRAQKAGFAYTFAG